MAKERELSDVEQQLLMAAVVTGMGPDTDLVGANTHKIVDQVLRWRGLSDEEIRHGWQKAQSEGIRGCKLSESINLEVYAALVKMVQEWQGWTPDAKEQPLFEGSGNWGVRGNPSKPACLPHYNSCRLSAQGEQLALQLLAKRPEYRKKV